MSIAIDLELVKGHLQHKGSQLQNRTTLGNRAALYESSQLSGIPVFLNTHRVWLPGVHQRPNHQLLDLLFLSHMLHTKHCSSTRMAFVGQFHRSTGNTGSHDRDVEGRVKTIVSQDTCVSKSPGALRSSTGPPTSTRNPGLAMKPQVTSHLTVILESLSQTQEQMAWHTEGYHVTPNGAVSPFSEGGQIRTCTTIKLCFAHRQNSKALVNL